MTETGREGAPFGLIRAAFTSEHYPELFSGKDTHEPALKLIAQLIRHTDNKELVRRIVLSGLPEGYDGDTVGEIDGMIEGAVARGFASPSPSGRRPPAEILMGMVESIGATFFHDERRRGFISVAMKGAGARNMALQSKAFRSWLRETAYTSNRMTVGPQPLQTVVDTLEAIACHRWPQERAHLRVARQGDVIFVDLGRDDGQVVRISPAGWMPTVECPVRFYRPDGYGELPLPLPGRLDALRDLLQLNDRSFALSVAFVLNAFRPGGPFMCLVVEGEQGSGKSVLSEVIKKLVDPSALVKTRLPESDRDLMVLAQEMHLPVFDNVSGVKNDMSDALCSLATGGGYGKRKNYTDDELVTFNFSRPFILNGIADFIFRPDLLDRALVLRLASMPDGQRREEDMIRSEFDAKRPELLGAIFDCIACALRREDEVKAPSDIRMIDAAKWIAAAAPATGLTEDDLLGAIVGARDELVIERIANDPVALALERLLARGPVQGLIKEVFDVISSEWDRHGRYLPHTPQHFSAYLTRIKPSLKRYGIFVDDVGRQRRGRIIKVWRAGQEDVAARSPSGPIDPIAVKHKL